MSRLALCAFFLVAACSKKSSNPPAPSVASGGGSAEVIPAAGSAETVPPPAGSNAAASSDEERFHIHPEEGTLSIDNASGAPGAETQATIKITPAAGYHVATDFPIKLTLEPTDGVKLAKTTFEAGGRDKSQGDAAALSEQGLTIAVKATPEKAGSYEIKGTFKFGICKEDACHPKKQPITITVAAK